MKPQALTGAKLRRFVSILVIAAATLAYSGCARSPQAKRDKYLAAGKTHMDKKDYARAVLDFKNAVRAMPGDAESYYQLGMALAANGDVKDAYLSLKKAVDLNPHHPEAALRLAQLLASAKDPDVVKMGQEQLNRLPGASTNPEILNSLALTQLKLGESTDAIQSLKASLARSPKQLASSIMLAMADLSKGDSKAAENALKQASATAPNSPDPHIVLGEFYASRGRLPEAEAELQRALQMDPKKLAAVFDLGMAQRAAGQMKDAEQTFQRLASSGDKNYKAVHAVFLFEAGRRQEAVSELEKLAKEDPKDRTARTRLVLAYEATNRTADAEKILDQALKKNSGDTDALLQKGEILESAGKYDEAEKDLNQVLSLKPDSAELHYAKSKLDQARGQTLTQRQELAETLRLQPDALNIRIEMAEVLRGAKDPKSALNVLDAAPKEQKGSILLLTERNWVLWSMGDLAAMRKGIDEGLAQGKTADLLIQDGLWKLREGKSQAAESALEEALKLSPADVRALEVLHAAYVSKGAKRVALEKVKEYASRAPKSAPMQEFLGTILLESGERDQARAAFTAAKAADPHFDEADLSLVQVDVLSKNLDGARNRLKTILASDSRNSTAHLWLGIVEQKEGDLNAAIGEYRKAVDANAQNAQALNNLAYLLADYANQVDQGLPYAQKARELDPNRPEYADTLGWIFYRKGLYQSAIHQMETAAFEKKANATIKYHLAMAYAKAGDAARGRTTLNAALQQNPNLPEAKAAEQAVGQSH